MYKENPKMKGSGIKSVIPQQGACPIDCKGCSFNCGLVDSATPNLPDVDFEENIVHVNDGNDSSHQQELVIDSCKKYKRKFYNTALPSKLNEFDAPVVLTVNPCDIIDKCFYVTRPVPKHLMFVRVLVNTWNLESVVGQAVWYYTHEHSVPVVFTFMRYVSLEDIPKPHRKYYAKNLRTDNKYFCITTKAWKMIIRKYEDNVLVSNCGKIEGEKGNNDCRFCGVCLREYYATKERMHDE